MANETVNISGPVKVTSDSFTRVAFELMQHIAAYEKNDAERTNRQYWLTLYRQCYKAAHGSGLESILKQD